MLLQPEERARLAAEQTHSRRHRRLFLPRCLSRSCTPLGQSQTGSEPTTPFGTQVPGSVDLFAQTSSRATPPAITNHPEPPRCDNICQTQHSPTDFAHHLWMIYSVHEQHNIQLGLPIFSSYGTVVLAHSGMPDSKIREYNSCRHAFPHVPQSLFSMLRPDGLPGQYFHLTQI
jgi:hypothetical protein